MYLIGECREYISPITEWGQIGWPQPDALALWAPTQTEQESSDRQVVPEPCLATRTERVPIQLTQVVLPQARLAQPVASAVNPLVAGEENPAEALCYLPQLGVYPSEPEPLEDNVVTVGETIPTCQTCHVVTFDRSQLAEVRPLAEAQNGEPLDTCGKFVLQPRSGFPQVSPSDLGEFRPHSNAPDGNVHRR